MPEVFFVFEIDAEDGMNYLSVGISDRNIFPITRLTSAVDRSKSNTISRLLFNFMLSWTDCDFVNGVSSLLASNEGSISRAAYLDRNKQVRPPAVHLARRQHLRG